VWRNEAKGWCAALKGAVLLAMVSALTRPYGDLMLVFIEIREPYVGYLERALITDDLDVLGRPPVTPLIVARGSAPGEGGRGSESSSGRLKIYLSERIGL